MPSVAMPPPELILTVTSPSPCAASACATSAGVKLSPDQVSPTSPNRCTSPLISKSLSMLLPLVGIGRLVAWPVVRVVAAIDLRRRDLLGAARGQRLAAVTVKAKPESVGARLFVGIFL